MCCERGTKPHVGQGAVSHCRCLCVGLEAEKAGWKEKGEKQQVTEAEGAVIVSL